MGKIKYSVIPKHEREKTESKPPSMRGLKRRVDRGKKDNREKVPQYIPPVLILKLKKKHQFNETVVHEMARRGFWSENHRPAKTSSRKVTQLTAPLSSVRAKTLRSMADAKKGELTVLPGRTVWHDSGVSV